MSHPIGVVICDAEDCSASFKNHRWGRIKGGEGWFISRDDTQAFCPEHLPDWVAGWRAKKNAK